MRIDKERIISELTHPVRIQGIVAASLFFLGGILTYGFDHHGGIMAMSFPDPLYGRVFDMF